MDPNMVQRITYIGNVRDNEVSNYRKKYEMYPLKICQN